MNADQAALNNCDPEIRIEAHRRHIVEKILTAHCPRCDQVWEDADGCDALTCHRCDCRFCGHCGRDCGEGQAGQDACHAHVLVCVWNPTVPNVDPAVMEGRELPQGRLWAPRDVYKLTQQKRIRLLVLKYMFSEATLTPPTLTIC